MTAQRDEAFGGALVATLYLLGARGEELATAAGEHAPAALLGALAHEDRAVRAAALAREIARVAGALDRGGVA
jgi:hypothetical protein